MTVKCEADCKYSNLSEKINTSPEPLSHSLAFLTTQFLQVTNQRCFTASMCSFSWWKEKYHQNRLQVDWIIKYNQRLHIKDIILQTQLPRWVPPHTVC